MRPSVYEPLERAPVSPPGPCGPDLPKWWGGKYPMNPTAIVDALGYPAAGLGILIESAGVPFPGEALLLAAAAWSAARHHSIVLVVLFGFLGSVAGAGIGGFLGHRGGRPFVGRVGSIFPIPPVDIAPPGRFFPRPRET